MFSVSNLSTMDQDFGAFSLSTSPPQRGLSSLTQYKHKHTFHPPSRSSSCLSPVVECNEEDNVTPDDVHIIVTNTAPSETFLKLTSSGVFDKQSEEDEVFYPDNGGEVQGEAGGNWKFVRDSLSQVTPELRVSGSYATPNQDANIFAGYYQGATPLHHSDTPADDCCNPHHNDASISKSPTRQKLNSNLTLIGNEDRVTPSVIKAGVKPPLSTPPVKIPLTRPKMRSNLLNSGSNQTTRRDPPHPRRSVGNSRIDTKPTTNSVEQAAHRDRVSSLPMPSSHRPALISSPSVSSASGTAPRKISNTPKESGSVNRKVTAPHTSSSGKTNTSVSSQYQRNSTDKPVRIRKIGQPNLSPANVSSSPQKITPLHNILPLNQTKPNDQKPGKPQRRKSLPDIRECSETGSSTRNNSCDSPKSPLQKVTPRRKISEPCFSSPSSPFSPPSFGDRHRGGLVSDPRYNPMIVTQKTSTVSGAGINTISSFEEEYVKLKSCRYIRRQNGDDDLPSM